MAAPATLEATREQGPRKLSLELFEAKEARALDFAGVAGEVPSAVVVAAITIL